MTTRALVACTAIAVAVIATTAGCAPVDHTYAKNGRCLHFQIAVAAEVHPGPTSSSPSWDLTFTNTSPVPCVFGGVPSVHFWARASTSSAGSVQRAVSEELVVQLGSGGVAYANVALDPAAARGCTPRLARSLTVVAPHVAGGGWIVKAPATFIGCAGESVVAHVGQVTAHRAK